MTTSKVTDDDGERGTPSPLHLARRAVRHAPVFLAVLAAGLTASAVLVSRTEQVYRSEAVILYRQAARQGYGEGDSARRAGSRLQDMLMSRERLRRIVDQQKLFPKETNRNAAVDETRKKVGFQARDGSTFLVWFDAATPALAQAVTRSLSQTLIDDNTSMRSREADNVRKLLEDQRRKVAAEVATKESVLARFFEANPDAAGRRESGGGETAGDSGEAGALRSQLEQLRERSGLPRKALTQDPEVLASQRRAEQDLAAAQKEMADKRDRVTEAHPDMVAARERVRRAEDGVKRARETHEAARANAEAEVQRHDVPDEVRSQMAAIERQLSDLRRSSGRSRGARISPRALQVDVQLQSLRHDLEQARERLAGLETKEFETTLNARLETSGEVGQLAILDPASRPGLPSVDKRQKVLLGGILASLLLALGAALVRARTDDRISDRADAEWLAGCPVLVSIPARPSERRRSAHG